MDSVDGIDRMGAFPDEWELSRKSASGPWCGPNGPFCKDTCLQINLIYLVCGLNPAVVLVLVLDQRLGNSFDSFLVSESQTDG